MAEYIPINVANELELKQALKLERTVIAVKNDDIRRSIQKKYQKTAKAKRLTSAGAVASTAAMAVCMATTGPVALVAGLAGLAGLSGSGLSGTVGSLTNQFSGYKSFVVLDRGKEQLLLLRVKGRNRFKTGDTVKGYSIQGYSSNHTKEAQ